MTLRIGEQLYALDIGITWIKAAGAAYLPKTHGVRAQEIDHVLAGLKAAQGALEWLAENRPAIVDWLAANRGRAGEAEGLAPQVAGDGSRAPTGP